MVEDDLVENVRNQGRADQVRIFLALPTEVKDLLAEFEAKDAQLRELEQEKEKYRNEVR